MSRWLEDNPIGIVLAATCAGLVVVSLILGVIWSMPPSAKQAEESVEQEPTDLEIPSLADSEPIDRYVVITERPVFNPGRQPELDLGGGDGDSEELVEEEVEAPQVQLAGIVITPSIRMATLRANDSNESLVAFEGKPLEGNFGSWHISRIEPRRVTLASAQGEEMDLSLEVHDQPIEAPPKPESKSKEVASSGDREENDQDGDRPMTRAEEIRQRIAERREELRRAAEEEEAASSTDAAAREPQAQYRSVIQSMITGNNRKRDNDEDEQ